MQFVRDCNIASRKGQVFPLNDQYDVSTSSSSAGLQPVCSDKAELSGVLEGEGLILIKSCDTDGGGGGVLAARVFLRVLWFGSQSFG